MNVQEGVPSNDAGEDGTGAVLTATAEGEHVGVAELASQLVNVIASTAFDRVLRNAVEATRVSFRYHRQAVEVRGNGAATVTEPSGGK